MKDRIEICENGGSEIVPVSDELREQLREASQNLYSQIKSVVNDDEFYEMYVR